MFVSSSRWPRLTPTSPTSARRRRRRWTSIRAAAADAWPAPTSSRPGPSSSPSCPESSYSPPSESSSSCRGMESLNSTCKKTNETFQCLVGRVFPPLESNCEAEKRTLFRWPSRHFNHITEKQELVIEDIIKRFNCQIRKDLWRIATCLLTTFKPLLLANVWFVSYADCGLC